MERKAGSKAIWMIAILAVTLVALATWLLLPVMSVVITIDKQVKGEVSYADYELQFQSWGADTFWVFCVAEDIGRAYSFYPLSTVLTVAYVIFAVPLWPLFYMLYRRKLHSTPRHFLAYLVSTSMVVGLGLWVYGLVPIQLYAR